MTISRNILILRKNKFLTQQELADLVGVKKQDISAWEKGKHKPRQENLDSLAKALGVTVSDLFAENLTLVEENKEQYGDPYIDSLKDQIQILKDQVKLLSDIIKNSKV